MNVEPNVHAFDPFVTSKEATGINDLEDVSDWLKQDLVEEVIQEGEFHNSLDMNDQSWSCFDFTAESLEPTPIRSTGAESMTFFGNLVPSSPNTSAQGMYPDNSSKIHHGAIHTSTPLSLRAKTARTASSRDGIDNDSCFIRPSKIARMVSNASLSPKLCKVLSPTKGLKHANLLTESEAKEVVTINKTAKSVAVVPDRGNSNKVVGKHRFRTYQNDQWNDRYQELKAFKREHGHCLVPHNHLHRGSPALAQWVKRQRFQYKQALQNKRTTITEERKRMLEDLGFCWDSHRVAWEEKYQSLLSFKEQHGHTDVPSNYDDKNLSIWVKCQRRQHKLLCQGKQSAMTEERISSLEKVQFNWNPRNL